MYLYIILICILFIALLEYKRINQRTETCLLILVISSLFILSFIRWMRGTDFETYYEYFLSISTLDFLSGFEPGYVLINYLCKVIRDDFTFCLFILAIILYVSLYIALKRLSPLPLFSLLCFFCVHYGGIFFVRQTVALTIIFYSIQFVILKRHNAFLYTILFAASIHFSALAFYSVYYIFYNRWALRQYLYIVVIALLLCVVINEGVFMWIANQIPLLHDKIMIYLYAAENGVDGTGGANKYALIMNGCVKRGIVICIYIWVTHGLVISSTLKGLFNIYFVGSCLYVVLANISYVFSRLTLFFDSIDCFLFAYLIITAVSKKQKLLLYSIFIVLSLYRYYGAVQLRYEYIIPFNTIWN